MKICRIQDISWRGPWRPNLSKRWIEDRPDHNNLLPIYIEFRDVDLSLHGKEAIVACGCRKEDELRRWFTVGEYRSLIKMGYRSVWINVERIIAESETQCIFAASKKSMKNSRIFKLYEV